MGTKRALLSFPYLVLLLSSQLGRAADSSEFARKSLVGITGLEVLVEFLKPEVERAGLTREAIQTDAELKLRLAGIHVLTHEESINSHAPILYLDPQVFRTDETSWGYSTKVAVLHEVRLVRDLSITVVNATTWEVTLQGGASRPANIPKRVREDLKDLVDTFINAYLAMNPKK